MSEETKDLNVVQVDSLDKVRLRFRTELFQNCFISILQKDYSLSTQDARKYFSDAVSGDANFARQIAGGIMSEYKPLEEAIWKMIENFGQVQTENMDPITIDVFLSIAVVDFRSRLD